ncbi:MAG: hypothetical protein V2I24_07775, partial [Halieaceae bacterium]|nr:hypothetical protein [Halieaceae bacterium]
MLDLKAARCSGIKGENENKNKRDTGQHRVDAKPISYRHTSQPGSCREDQHEIPSPNVRTAFRSDFFAGRGRSGGA